MIERSDANTMTIAEKMIEYAGEIVKRYGIGHVLSRGKITDDFEIIYHIDKRKQSVIPSDYCYNRINNGISVKNPTVFEYLGNSQYRCYGVGYPFNGPVYHQPKGQPEFVVGKCINGVREIAPDSDSLYISSATSQNVRNSMNTDYLHKTQRSPSTRLRFDVLKRDNFKCCACGASPAKDPNVTLHLDHIIPWSKGGETKIDNLQTLCSECNLGKSDRH